MWDSLRFLPNDPDPEDGLWDHLGAQQRVGVDVVLLDRVRHNLERALRTEGVPLRLHLRIIPPARTRNEQLSVLDALSNAVGRGDVAYLDVTNGFRHLPMLSLLAALHLGVSKQVPVKGVYYGAWEMKDENDVSPVLNLSGIQRLGEAVSALGAYERTGDVSALADALEAGGLPADWAVGLREGRFFEETGQLARAVAAYRATKAKISRAGEATAGPLGTEIARALRWSDEPKVADRMFALARWRAERGQLQSALTLGVEAYVTREVERAGGNPDSPSFEDRERAKQNLRGAGALPRDWTQAQDRLAKNPSLKFKLLNDLRNNVVHGMVDHTAELVSWILADRKRMVEVLRVCLG